MPGYLAAISSNRGSELEREPIYFYDLCTERDFRRSGRRVAVLAVEAASCVDGPRLARIFCAK